MKLLLQRVKNNGDTTIGKMYINGKYFCDTLEDEPREAKVKGETRIPKGVYNVKKRKVLSGLTQKYRNRFTWFDNHLMLQDVPNFNYVYIHVGNTDEHTDGCILLGEDTGNWTISNSVKTYSPFYKQVSKALQDGEDVTLIINDEN